MTPSDRKLSTLILNFYLEKENRDFTINMSTDLGNFEAAQLKKIIVQHQFVNKDIFKN